MGFKQTDETLRKVADNEPIFVLRAQDKLAPMIVHAWALAAQVNGVSLGKIREARSIADHMKQWQRDHGRKTPD